MPNHIPQHAQEVAATIREATRALPVRGPQDVTTHDGVIVQMYLRCSTASLRCWSEGFPKRRSS